MERFRHVYLSQVYFKAMWVFALLLYILIPLQSGIVSLIYKGILFITFFCFVILFFKGLNVSRFFVGSKETIYVMMLAMTILISLMFSSGTINFDKHIMGILGFMEMPLSIMLMDCVDYNKTNTKFVFYINILIAIVFSILSVTKYAYSGIIDNLYLGYSNPNATAIYLLLNQTILIMFLPMLNKIMWKYFVVGLCIYEEYLIYLTGSRTCLFVSIIIVVYYLFGKNVKMPKWIIVVAMVFPIIFILAYSNMYVGGKYEDLQILGKELYSGREVYFLSQMDILTWKNVLGDVRKYHFTNMHNGPLTVIASCGMLGYAWWFLFYYGTIRRYYRDAQNTLQYIALVAILGVFIHSCSEAALIVAGAHYSIIVATFYWILKGKRNHITI